MSRLGVLIVVLVAAAVVAVGAFLHLSSRDGAVEVEVAPIVWSSCFLSECGLLRVPLDHDDPDGETIALQVVRTPAADPARRIGTLLFVAGGPGASGIDQDANLFSQELRDRFDIVRWDPRGVSDGTQVRCIDDRESLLSDTTPAEARRLARRFIAGCARRGGALLPHLSTLDSVRDMELLRRALGEEQLSLLGVSYGTAVSSLYATLHPERVRAAVLDGAFDPSAPLDRLELQGATARGAVLARMLRWCAAEESCAFGRSGDPVGALERLLERLRARPLHVDGTTLGPQQALLGIRVALYDRDYWPSLGAALAAAESGDGRPLHELAAGWVGETDAGFAIACLDRPRSAWTLAPAAREAVAVVRPTRFRIETQDRICAQWPVAPSPIPEIRVRGAGPVLVIGATGDVATPLAAARDLMRKIESASLLVVEHDGHLTYFGDHPDRACVREAVDPFLVELQAPARGARCAIPPAVDEA